MRRVWIWISLKIRPSMISWSGRGSRRRGGRCLLSQVLGQVQDLISMGFLAVGVMTFNPWLILLLVVAVVPAFLGESHFNDRSYALTRSQTEERRELDYLRYLGASDDTAKEVKLFGLSDFLVGRFRTLAEKFYSDGRALMIRRSAWGTLFALLGSVGYYSAYVVIIFRAVNGSLSIGDLTFLAGSFRQLRSSAGGDPVALHQRVSGSDLLTGPVRVLRDQAADCDGGATQAFSPADPGRFPV